MDQIAKAAKMRAVKKQLGYSNQYAKARVLGLPIPKGKGFTNKEVFVANSSYQRGHIKFRVIRDKLIELKCEECPLTNEWNNKPIVLRLDHRNGIHNDHRLENLRFLCPNCDSQQPTYSGRRKPYKKA